MGIIHNLGIRNNTVYFFSESWKRTTFLHNHDEKQNKTKPKSYFCLSLEGCLKLFSSHAFLVSWLILCWHDARRCDALKEIWVKSLKLHGEIFATETNKKKQKRSEKFNKTTRDNGPFRLYSKCACVNDMYFMLVCTSMYRMEHKKTESSVSERARAQAPCQDTPKSTTWRK